MVDALDQLSQIQPEALKETGVMDLPWPKAAEDDTPKEIRIPREAFERYVLLETLARKLVAPDTEQHVRLVAEIQLAHMLL